MTYSDSSSNPQIFLLEQPNLDPETSEHIKRRTNKLKPQREVEELKGLQIQPFDSDDYLPLDVQ